MSVEPFPRAMPRLICHAPSGQSHSDVTPDPNPKLVPMLMRGNAVPDAPASPGQALEPFICLAWAATIISCASPDRTRRRSVEDCIPTEDHGNEFPKQIDSRSGKFFRSARLLAELGQGPFKEGRKPFGGIECLLAKAQQFAKDRRAAPQCSKGSTDAVTPG